MIKLYTPGFSADFVNFISKNKFDGAEIEFVRSIYLTKDEKINEVKKIASELGVKLSIHAPYFINLASLDEKILKRSIDIIVECCKVGDKLGVKYVCFHPAFYQKRDSSDVYKIVLKSILEIKKKIDELGLKVVLAPELMGKKSQFGSLDELLKLIKDVPGISLTVDFAHYLARYGSIDYDEVVSKLPSSFHAHFSGIEYGEKGEIRHLPIDVKAFRLLVKALVKYKKDVSLVCESSDFFNDLILMKKILKELS
ncbi:MAG: TIM barrel protein [Candidatus Woesearchaeota archaeon]